MDSLNNLLPTAVLVWAYMTIWFGIATIKKRNDIADIAWGLGFILISGYNLYSFFNWKIFLLTGLITLWGLRLALHILERNKNKKEDFRYQEMKEKWKTNFLMNSYLRVFLLQGFLMWLIALPLMTTKGEISLLNLLGVLVWITGFYFESTADKQLKDFLKNPKNKGKIMDKGLWAKSRHPNYFGEVVMWWGVWIISLSGINGLLSIVGPITITLLILKVSGIPLLEKKYQGNKLYEIYKKKTSVFWPR